MRILYVSRNVGTTKLRFQILEKLGHDVTFVNPNSALPKSRLAGPWLWRFGGPGYDRLAANYLAPRVKGQTWDVAWVDSGDVVGRRAMKILKSVAKKVMLFNVDNPFVARDGRRWDILKTVLAEYDLYVTVRASTVDLAAMHGSRRTVRLFQACDKDVNTRKTLSDADIAHFSSDVSFIGTWMPGRDDFAADLLARGVPLKVFGPNWEKSPRFEQLKGAVVAGELSSTDYAKALQCAKICVGLISKGNVDEHTQRSVEVPTIGSVLCAERTDDHLALYEDGKEALFWETVDECAQQCLDLLKDPERLKSVAEAGHRRALANNHFYEPMMTHVLEDLLQ